MAFAQSPSTSMFFSETQAQREYKVFLFSVPILFCILLFMSLYLFYLQKRASDFSRHLPVSPTITRNSSFSFVVSVGPLSPVCEVGLREDIKDKLPTVVFDEELKAKDSVCCVCLGEFEMKEELIQVRSCKHIFHSHCIRNWLNSSTTCPLCRCSVVDNTKFVLSPPQRSPAFRLPPATVQFHPATVQFPLATI